MEQVTELTEVQKAELVIKEAEAKKHQEFNDKLNALCEEYGFILQIQANIVAIKR